MYEEAVGTVSTWLGGEPIRRQLATLIDSKTSSPSSLPWGPRRPGPAVSHHHAPAPGLATQDRQRSLAYPRAAEPRRLASVTCLVECLVLDGGHATIWQCRRCYRKQSDTDSPIGASILQVVLVDPAMSKFYDLTAKRAARLTTGQNRRGKESGSVGALSPPLVSLLGACGGAR